MKNIFLFIVCFFFAGYATLADGALAEEGDQEEPKPDKWTIIQAGVLIAVPGKTPLREQSILIKNDRIEQIVDGYVDQVDGAGDAAIIDLKSSYVLPGLIDAHVHLGLGGGDGRRTEERGADAYRIVTIAENARKTLDAGFTTVRNVGSSGWALFAFRDGVNAGVLTGPRVFTAGHTIRIGTFRNDGAGACYNVSSCKKAVRRQIEMGADWIKLYATCSGGAPCGREHAPAVFMEEEIEAVIETAKTRQIPVAAHAHGTDGINKAITAGVRTVEHGSYNTKESHRLWKKHGSYLVPTLAVQDNIRKDYETATDEMKPVMEAFMSTHPDRVAAAFKAGVKIAAGSDAGVVPHGDNANELLWYVRIGMSPAEALRAATIVNAEMLQKSDDLGSVAPGKYADIIALKADPLADIEAVKDVVFVMAAGEIVKND